MNSLPKVQEKSQSLDELCETPAHINEYMVKFYKYLTAASIMGIATAQILSFSVPVGIPSAYLFLTGFALEHYGSEYVDKTKPKNYTYQDQDGNIKYGVTNSWKRKLGFTSTVLGYGCIIGSLLGLVPVATSVLPLSAITCLFSTLGHLNYCKFAQKSKFNPIHLFISGVVTGTLGLNLVTSGATIFLYENFLHMESIEMGTYIGMVLYNMFTSHDSQKAIEDVENGKGDYLKHANKFSENWLYSLIPHFLMNIIA